MVLNILSYPAAQEQSDVFFIISSFLCEVKAFCIFLAVILQECQKNLKFFGPIPPFCRRLTNSLHFRPGALDIPVHSPYNEGQYNKGVVSYRAFLCPRRPCSFILCLCRFAFCRVWKIENAANHFADELREWIQR
jgi:hypothetical protein